MAEVGYPAVYVVDSHVNRPSVPPRLSRRPQRASVAQTLLFLLVSLALCGMAIEACFIYRLYRTEAEISAMSSKLTAGAAVTTSVGIHPSKPVAHLTDGQDVDYGKAHNHQIMEWSTIAEPLLHEMSYEEGHLIIQKEGFYYVYSKVAFLGSKVFSHAVKLNTKLYSGKSITLLQSRKLSEVHKQMRSNSFLGGVFHLHKDDAVFVSVSNTSNLVRHKSYENTFGAYMI